MALLAQEVGGVYAQPLVEHGGVGGVEVLGLAAAQDSPAEAQDVAVLVNDGEDGPVAEHVEGAPGPGGRVGGGRLGLLDDRQPCQAQLLQGVALLLQGTGQAVPLVRGSAKAKLADDAVREPAALEVVQHGLALRGEQRLVEVTGRLLVGGKEPVALGAAPLVVGILLHLREGHVHLIGQEPDRLGKIQPLHVHNELNHTAAGLAAEAVIELALAVHGKGGCFFAVKRAQTPISMPVPLQCHIA